jgi:hypothetical protein
VVTFKRQQQFFFSKRKTLYNSLLYVRNLPFNYRRSLFIQQVLLGNFLRLLEERILLDLVKFIKTRSKLNICIVFLYNRKITAQVISSYFIQSFRKMYLPGEVVARFFSRVVKPKRRGDFLRPGPAFWGIAALMVKASGRFTRKQRAFYQIYRFGPLSLSRVIAPVRYDFKTTPLKFGAVGIKVYLVQDERKKDLFLYTEKIP